MAIAHVCMQCGFDLARVRPFREPHYGLPLVQCPKCSFAVVRRAHPLRIGWRAYRRLDWSLRVLAAQFGLIVLFCIVDTTAIITLLASFLGFEREDNDARENFFWSCIFAFAIAGPATGAWLTAAFSHLRLWQAWLFWLVVLSLPLLATVLISLIVQELPPEFSQSTGRTRDGVAILAAGLALIVLPGMTVACGMMVTAVAGVPLGKLLLWVWSHMRRSIVRWHRKRRKLGRSM